MEAEKKQAAEHNAADKDKDGISQGELKNGVKTFEDTDKPHAALETPDGKNNGAEPAVFAGQKKSRT